MNILIVEDEVLMADFTRRGLQAEGHRVAVATDAATGQAEASTSKYDLILLDIGLPDQSGYDLCEELRGSGVSTPIIMLTARDAVSDRIAGLRCGADDYIVKPFAFEELILRINTVARRRTRSQLDPVQHSFEHHDIVLDIEAKRVTRNGAVIELTAKEFGILELLMRRPGAVMSRERILNSVWALNTDPLTNIVEVYVARLRRKLQEHGPQVIETARGFGYRLVLPMAGSSDDKQ
jgi:DNA-binding response OmpR family regulator